MTKPVCPACKNVDHGAVLPANHGGRFFFTRCGHCRHGYRYNAAGQIQSTQQQQNTESALREFRKTMQSGSVPARPLAVYTSNSWRRVGLKDTYREIMAPTTAPDGHSDIRGVDVLHALVAAFNAMLTLASPADAAATEVAQPTRLGPDTPDNSMVICPACTSQFVAIPVDVQKKLRAAQDRIAWAWAVIANVSNWDQQHEVWRKAAADWYDVGDPYEGLSTPELEKRFGQRPDREEKPRADQHAAGDGWLENCYVFSRGHILCETLEAWLSANVPSTDYYKHDKKRKRSPFFTPPKRRRSHAYRLRRAQRRASRPTEVGATQ